MGKLPEHYNCKVAIVGLGYVGLPLAIEIVKNEPCVRTGAKCFREVVGFDIDKERLKQLSNSIDRTNELSGEETKLINNINLTSNIDSLAIADVFIITVPTPIDDSKDPELSALRSASNYVGKAIKKKYNLKNNIKKPIIIFESTVFPGVTEDICIPIIESASGLKSLKHFCCGYSPERINPGDSSNKLRDIIKITSGQNQETADWIDDFYGSFINAGTHKAESIKVAETAKIIENTQRDLNIALVNELAIICRYQGVDTLDVLKAANTKWNFNDFKPGLVGGHCIGVDPYYLTYKAKLLGYKSKVVLAGRKMNDSIGKWIINELMRTLAEKYSNLSDLNILVLGITFKENCPDIRNSGVYSIIETLQSYNVKIEVVDPIANINQNHNHLNFKLLREIPSSKKYESVIAAVAHKEFCDLRIDQWLQLIDKRGIFLDIKGIMPRSLNAIRL